MGDRLSVALVTFGCQMNRSRSEHILHLFLQDGFSEAQEEEEADVLVFNTCAVREHAVARAVGVITHLYHAALRRRGQPPCVVLCGCMSELLREELLVRLPCVRVLTGTHNIEELPSLVREACATGERKVVFSPPSLHFTERGYRRKGKVSAYLPIAFGCDNFCSYCVVPYTTGPQRSKPHDVILEELDEVVREGFREVILLGQNVNSYGKDLGNPRAFESLLEDIERRFGGEKIWVRFITSHPRDMRREIVEIVRGSRVLCPYFHLPLQAGSDRILALMNRGYTQKEYLRIASFIRERIPEAVIGTDIIVGFPTESEDDFAETLRVVQEVQFEIAYTYVYSPRPRTKAAQLNDDVPQEVKKERLQALNDRLREAYLRRLCVHEGRVTEVLLLEEDGELVARTRENLRVFLEGGGNPRAGSFLEVRLARNPQGKCVGIPVLCQDGGES